MNKNYTISNCHLSYECSKTWNDLTDLPGEDDIKYCSACRDTVHRCDNEDDLDKLISEGRCIAYFDSELIHTTGQWISLPNPKEIEKDLLLIKIARLSHNDLSILSLINDKPGITNNQIASLSGIPTININQITHNSLKGLCIQDDNSSWFATRIVSRLLDEYRHTLQPYSIVDSK